MRSRRVSLPSQTAALAGIPAGIQAIGPWSGRRQLFVKFAFEAETATMFTADALRGELQRLTSRSSYHSIALAGHDPLAESEYLSAALHGNVSLPVMLDHDGQRPEALARLLGVLTLVQVVMDGTEGEAAAERACATIELAAGRQVRHTVVLVPAEGASDGQLWRIVEQAHSTSDGTEIVLHPSAESARQPNRRWVLWLERAAGLHGDVRVVPPLPAPTGMR
jgi:hypothetical protein